MEEKKRDRSKGRETEIDWRKGWKEGKEKDECKTWNQDGIDRWE